MISCLVLPALLSEETKILTPRLSPSSLPSSRASCSDFSDEQLENFLKES